MFRSHDILTIVALKCTSHRIWHVRLRFAIRNVTNNELTFLLYNIPFSDDTVFRRIRIFMADVGVAGCFNSQELKRRAILLSLREDPSSTTEVDVEFYKVALVYTDIGGDKAMISSDTDLIDVGSQFNTKGEVKVFVSVEIKKDEEESPTLEWVAESSTVTTPSATATQANNTTTPAPFIHGRHTCNGCRTNPIIGTRYRATNLHDYDLCSQCKDIYQGEIRFHPIQELDRDGPFQERWQRRQEQKQADESPTLESSAAESSIQADNSATSNKAMIASDTDLIDVGSQSSAAAQFTRGGLQVFANVQSTEDKDNDEAKNLTELIAEGIHRYFEDAKKAEENKREQMQAIFIRRYIEDANKAKAKKQADLIVEASNRRCLEDAKKAEEQKQTDAVTHNLEVAVHKKEEKDAQSETFEENETIDKAAREEEQVGSSDEQESDDETADSTPQLAALKEYQEYQIFYSKASPVKPLPLPKEIEVFSEDDESTDERNIEEEQVGSSDEEESDDETADSTPPLATREEYQMYKMFCPTASPVKPPLPKELDIVSKVDAATSFASDAEGSGEIAAVLGETLDRVAQAIDDMHSEFDRTASAEEIEKDIVAEDAKEVNDESWNEDLDPNISELGENAKDDCSNDSWNVVSDHSDNAGPRD
jgi:hypothetical protein